MQRIKGIETEQCLGLLGGFSRAQEDVAWHIESVGLDYIFNRVFELNGEFLSNGGRLYLDINLPEYATPECRDLGTLVAQVMVGDRLMARLAGALNEEFGYALGANTPGVPSLSLLKRNVDRNGDIVGTHENYLIDPALPDWRLLQGLIPFLVTRQMLAGGGVVRSTVAGPQLAMSERAFSVGWDFSPVRGTSVGLIRRKDKHLADKARFRRLEILGGDSNRNEMATFFKVGSTDLLLTAIEERWGFGDLGLENPVADMARVSQEGPGAKLRMTGGGRWTVAEIQEAYLNRLTNFASKHELDRDPEVREVLTFWERGLHAVATDRLDLVEGEVDWVMKRRALTDGGLREWMSELIEAGGLRSESGQLLRPEDIVDTAFADVSSAGLHAEMDRRGLVEHVVSAEAVSAAEHTPPADTRAAVRGPAARLDARDVQVDWDSLKFPAFGGDALYGDSPEVALPDPHQVVSLSAEGMLEAARDQRLRLDGRPHPLHSAQSRPVVGR